jgi:hypothetical protein
MKVFSTNQSNAHPIFTLIKMYIDNDKFGERSENVNCRNLFP